MSDQNTKFKVGTKLSARSICDSECIFTAEVLKVTPKTVTIKTRMSGVKRCKIHNTGGADFIYPEGRYSMAHSFRADRAEAL